MIRITEPQTAKCWEDGSEKDVDGPEEFRVLDVPDTVPAVLRVLCNGGEFCRVNGGKQRLAKSKNAVHGIKETRHTSSRSTKKANLSPGVRHGALTHEECVDDMAGTRTHDVVHPAYLEYEVLKQDEKLFDDEEQKGNSYHWVSPSQVQA